MKKLICLFLALMMLPVSLASCGDKKSEEQDTTETAETQGVTTEETKKSLLPEKDFGGQVVKVLQRSDCYKQEWNYEWESIDILSDALAEKTAYLEKKYNISFEYYDCGLLESSIIKNNISAGNQAYDFLSFSPLFIEGFTESGLTRRMDYIPNLNLDQSYWYQNLNGSLALDGNQYFLFGASNLSSLWTAYGVFMNRTLLESLYKGNVDIYQMVRDKTWTVEAMFDIAKDAYYDIDGDGYSLKDRYGIIYAGGSWYSLFYGSGMQFVKVGDDGNFTCDLSNDNAITLLQRIIEVIGNRSYTKEFIANDDDDEWEDFVEGRSLFIPESMAISNMCRKNMSDEYGILPNPLLTEGQSSYYSEIHPNHSSAFAVPIDVPTERFDLIGCILEDGCYIAEQVQLPAYYNSLLKGRIAHDPESVEMLDYLYSNLMLDAALVYAQDLDITVRSLVDGGDSTKVVSSLRALEDPLKIKLSELSENLRGLKDDTPGS